MSSPKPLKVNVNATIEVDCLMFPSDALEFAQNWIVVKQVDETEDGVTTGVCYYIRKRKEEDPAGAFMIDSI
jgi:hypothetical protein